MPARPDRPVPLADRPETRRWRHRGVVLALAAIAALASFDAIAARPESRPIVAPDAALEAALKQATEATVGLRIEAAQGASSGESLGRQRLGSGVVIGPDGLILTIGYLLIEAQSVEVVTFDQKRWPARVVAYDQATGFGLLQPLVPLRNVRPVPLGRSAGLSDGELVMASVGPATDNSMGVAVTQLVSQRPFSGYWEYHIDAALFTSPPVAAHSGAPLFDRRGQLVGIGSLFTMEVVPGRALPGNMFVPIDLLKPVLAEMQATGSTRASRRPWLGLSSSARSGKVQILRVNRQSPAEAAGLHEGDVVLAIDGAPVGTLEDFYKKLWAHPDPDAEVELTVQQGEAVRNVRLRSVDRAQTFKKAAGI